MKVNKTIFLFSILLSLIPSAIAADEIVVIDADSVWDPDLTSASSDVTDSTDTPPQNLIKRAFVSHADTVWNIDSEKPDWVEPPEKWSFAIITDLHIGRGYSDYGGTGYGNSGEGEDYYLTERLKKVVDWIIENKNDVDCDGTKCPIQFVAILGDISDSGEKSEYLKAKSILDALNDPNNDGDTADGIPYVPVFGNHDILPHTDSEQSTTSLGENCFEEIFWNENAANTKLLKEKLNFQRGEENKGYKNFTFKYGDINFIGLDFVSREFAFFGSGVGSDAVLFNATKNWLNENPDEYSTTSIILFSHHPITENSMYAFKNTAINQIKEIIKDKNILVNFGGHIHGFYDPKWYFLDLWEHWENSNEKQYPAITTTSVVTTESLTVGSNEENNYLKEHDKGIIKIVKVLDENEIDYKTNEGKYNPETEEGKEFIALNPYISFTFTQPTTILPCVFFKAHTFTKREVSYYWDFGDGITDIGEFDTRCYTNAGTYNVTLTVTDTETGKQEYITQKVEIKEGIISKFIKIAEDMADKIELISAKLNEDLTKIGQLFQDTVLIKIKQSEAKPVGAINVHFEQAIGDIDLTQMIVDINIDKQKSILYMSAWPTVVEKNKILFVPK